MTSVQHNCMETKENDIRKILATLIEGKPLQY